MIATDLLITIAITFIITFVFLGTLYIGYVLGRYKLDKNINVKVEQISKDIVHCFKSISKDTYNDIHWERVRNSWVKDIKEKLES